MKQLIYIIMVALLPLSASAQGTGLFGATQPKAKQTVDYSQYGQGTLPVNGGKVEFSKTISLEGKTPDAAYRLLTSWASARFMANVENGKWNEPAYFRNLQYSKVVEANEQTRHIVCQGCEEQVFKNQFLSKDFTEVEYTLTIDITTTGITATMANIAYNYTFANERERRTAEEVITDDVVFTKKGKWIPAYRKFRVKTVNLAQELFREIEFTME